MSHQVQFAQTMNGTQVTRHPLDPLSAAEMEAAVAIIRDHEHCGDTMRFISVNLHEPEINRIALSPQ